MKAIILAAGQGTRLWKYTRDRPKGMISFLGKSLLEYQIENFRKLGINDIIIVKGYKQDKINFKNIKYYINKDYEKTNMVESLMCAVEEFDSPCILTYADIFFEIRIMEKLLKSKFDIGVTVDKDFEEYWKLRLSEDYLEDMESLVISNKKIVALGKPKPKDNEINGRYIGAIKFSKNGIKSLVKIYNDCKRIQPKNKLKNRKFDKWHMTDLLQQMIDEGCEINPILVSRGWLEFDTEKDYENYNNWYKEGMIDRFVKI